MALSRATHYCRMGGAEQNVAIAHVSESQLAALLEYDASCLAAARNNEPRPGVPPTLGSAKVLSNRVRAAAGYAGSNAQRQVQQRRRFGLQTLFGSAFVFVTASTKDNGSLTVAYLAGDVDASKLIHVGSRDLPTQAQRFASSAKDAVAAARYFHRAFTTFFEVLLGYDMEAQRPLARGGIFGHLEALIAGVETQGEGTLHFHALGWIHGTPRLLSELRNKLEDAFYREAFTAFADGVQQQSVPLTVAKNCAQCALPGNKIVAVAPGPGAFRKRSRGAAAVTARCMQCSADFAHDDLIGMALRRALGDLLGEPVSAQDVETLLRPLVILPPHAWVELAVGKIVMEVEDVRRRELAEAVVTTYMVVHCNVHLWQHCDSCFKQSRRTGDLGEGLFRYLYPREPTEVTVIYKQMCALPRRAIGSEYVNAYSSTIMLVMPTNHDIRLLAGRDAMYYALKYALKDQQAITNSALLVAAF